jgi:hypothetical protein
MGITCLHVETKEQYFFNTVSYCCFSFSGHGVCMDQGLDKSCVCYGGWGGPNADCSELTCDYNCHNRGMCNNGTCFCKPPFTGEFCEKSTCNPECIHGTCDHQLATCTCEPTWQGNVCDQKICSEHGDWEQTMNNGKGGCKCRLGWGGDDCNTTSLCLPGTCANGGYCGESQRCICPHDFTGATCEQIVCPNACSGHGTCNSNTFTCDCDELYDGLLCSQRTDFRTASDVMLTMKKLENEDSRSVSVSKPLRGM